MKNLVSRPAYRGVREDLTRELRHLVNTALGL
jgi:hypothetical protein